MRALLALILIGIATVPAAAQETKEAKKPLDPQNTLILELKTGKVTIQLRPDLAPKHVDRVKQLAREGFYNGIIFHRVIADFMAQTGDPTGTGSGGSQLPNLPAEFTQTPFQRGTVGAARTNDPNSANSQFFICFKATPSLNGQYTVWGQVVDGMNHVDAIAKGEPPPAPDKIVKMYVLADAPAGAPAKTTAPATKAPAAKAASTKAPDSKAAPSKAPPAAASTKEVLPWAKK